MSFRKGQLARTADLIALVMKKPRTIRELAELMGVKNHESVRHWIKAFQAEGLVYVTDFPWPAEVGQPAALFAWQAKPFERQDMTQREWRRRIDARKYLKVAA